MSLIDQRAISSSSEVSGGPSSAGSGTNGFDFSESAPPRKTSGASNKAAKGGMGRFEAQGEGCHGRLTIGLLPPFTTSGQVYNLAKVCIRHDVRHVKAGESGPSAAGDEEDEEETVLVVDDATPDSGDQDPRMFKEGKRDSDATSAFPAFPASDQRPRRAYSHYPSSDSYQVDGMNGGSMPPSSAPPSAYYPYSGTSASVDSGSLIPFAFSSSEVSTGQYSSHRSPQHQQLLLEAVNHHHRPKDVVQESRLLDATSVIAGFVHARIVEGLHRDLADRIEKALQPMMTLVAQVDPVHFGKGVGRSGQQQQDEMDGIHGHSAR